MKQVGEGKRSEEQNHVDQHTDSLNKMVDEMKHLARCISSGSGCDLVTSERPIILSASDSGEVLGTASKVISSEKLCNMEDIAPIHLAPPDFKAFASLPQVSVLSSPSTADVPKSRKGILDRSVSCLSPKNMRSEVRRDKKKTGRDGAVLKDTRDPLLDMWKHNITSDDKDKGHATGEPHLVSKTLDSKNSPSSSHSDNNTSSGRPCHMNRHEQKKPDDSCRDSARDLHTIGSIIRYLMSDPTLPASDEDMVVGILVSFLKKLEPAQPSKEVCETEGKAAVDDPSEVLEFSRTHLVDVCGESFADYLEDLEHKWACANKFPEENPPDEKSRIFDIFKTVLFNLRNGKNYSLGLDVEKINNAYEHMENNFIESKERCADSSKETEVVTYDESDALKINCTKLNKNKITDKNIHTKRGEMQTRYYAAALGVVLANLITDSSKKHNQTCVYPVQTEAGTEHSPVDNSSYELSMTKNSENHISLNSEKRITSDALGESNASTPKTINETPATISETTISDSVADPLRDFKYDNSSITTHQAAKRLEAQNKPAVSKLKNEETSKCNRKSQLENKHGKTDKELKGQSIPKNRTAVKLISKGAVKKGKARNLYWDRFIEMSSQNEAQKGFPSKKSGNSKFKLSTKQYEVVTMTESNNYNKNMIPPTLKRNTEQHEEIEELPEEETKFFPYCNSPDSSHDSLAADQGQVEDGSGNSSREAKLSSASSVRNSNTSLLRTSSRLQNSKADWSRDSTGLLRYRLSDPQFLERGWSVIPSERLVARVRTFSSRPARGSSAWTCPPRPACYRGGAPLCSLGEGEGGATWHYPGGGVAASLSRGELVVLARGEPRLVLARLHARGDGAVFGPGGEPRLRYTQRGGVLLDPRGRPAMRWAWRGMAGVRDHLEELVCRHDFPGDPHLDDPASLCRSRAYREAIARARAGPRSKMSVCAEEEEQGPVQCGRQQLPEEPEAGPVAPGSSYTPIRPIVLRLNEFFTFRLVSQEAASLQFRAEGRPLRLELGVRVDRSVVAREDLLEPALLPRLREDFVGLADLGACRDT
ncbi:uncharacterized protein LOC134536339 [Bacillus rossius redtenbacheri]|uniref:uncharacterized protein LOC134536339 n=1 Tax=Bacillus rossius redtenbacheri TaxID=93214 RepID=UPI002FDD0F2F